MADTGSGFDNRHRAPLTTVRISPAPPRGMTTSTRPSRWISSVTASRSGILINWTAPSGRPALRPAAMRASLTALLEWRASGPLQDHGITAFHAECDGIGRHIGASFINDANQSQRTVTFVIVRPLESVRPLRTFPTGPQGLQPAECLRPSGPAAHA